MISTLLVLATLSLTNAAQLATALARGELGSRFDLTASAVFPNTRESPFIVIQDDSGSTSMRNLSPRWNQTVLACGAKLAASGTITKDNYGLPCAIIDTCRVVSEGVAPQAVETSALDLRSGRHDYRLVRLQGTIREIFRDEIDPNWIYLSLDCDGTSIYVVFCPAQDQKDAVANLNDVTASITGVCLPHDEGYRKITGRIVMISGPEAITTLKSPPSDPFEVPALPTTDELDPAAISAMARHRLVGHVVAVCRNDRILLRDSAGKLHMIRCKTGPLPRYGQSVEVVGYPETDLYRINLYDASWRSHEAPAIPEDRAADIAARAIFKDKNDNYAIKPSYHGRFIRLTGIVQDLPSAGTGQGTVILKSGDFSIPVDISANRSVLDSLSIGCEVSVDGTCIVETENWRPYASFPHATGITLVVRKPSDITILSRPPWWTPQRLLIVVTSLLVALIGVFIWNRWLNRLVSRRSRALVKEQLSLAEAELKIGERTRLAIELHDSLSQNLSAVACQVSATKSAVKVNAIETMSNLNTVERMLLSCRSELRRCLWDLRNDALDEHNMTEVIRKVLAPVLGKAELLVRFNVSRARLDDSTLHSVICIVRELTANAVVHGQATRISVAGDLDDDVLAFSVDENGTGFDPKNCKGPAEGHFGLAGVRERVDRLGGTFRIETQSIGGTYSKITFRLPQNDVED